MPFYYAHAKLPEINYQKLVILISAAKVMLFFELCKKTHTFFVIFLHFLPNHRKFAENSAFFRRKSQNSGIFRTDSVR